ncbi:MAG: PASTA domain-containing protein [Treponema sp.]|jgi:beta-lactam-binding protein with PASTA domain|nr:PASTA domain-containing protein [Treponema sp.]
MGFFNIDPDGIERYVANHLRLFLSMAAGLIVFVGIIAMAVFFIALRGAEQTMVPDVRGKDITAALMELQVKELYPRIYLRYSQSSSDKGFVLEQEPKAGTIVKAGRRIRLVVSQGVIINNVENYVGRNIDEVRMDLQTLFASSGSAATVPLLSLKEPFIYQYSSEAPGTILQQNPLPGTDISGPIVLEFVLSRGPENVLLTVPNLVGLSVPEALEEISRSGVDFTFTLRPRRGGEAAEMVVFQDPPGDTMIPSNARLSVIVTSPEQPENGEVFALFKYHIPKNLYPLAVRLEALLPSGERQRLFTVEYLGGELTVPYRLPVGSVLILSMLNREIYRETVTLPPETSPEQL